MQIFDLKINTKDGLACPARFERATYALDAVKMRLNNSRNNGIKQLAFGVASAPRTLVLRGIDRVVYGIRRYGVG